MKVIVEGNINKIFKAPDFKDKETGEVTEGKYKLQMIVDVELSNGSIKNEFQDISIPKEQLKDYEVQVGKTVQVPCYFISKSQVSFYVK